MSLNKKIKQKLLDDLLEKHKNLPKQGSEQWLEIRKNSVGGSEIAMFVPEVFTFKTVKEWAMAKCGLAPSFTGNMFTRWGSIFETVGQKFMEHILSTKVFEFSSLPGAIKHQRYSPDGISVIGFYKNPVDLSDKTSSKKYYIVLFEFKHPFSRIPSGKIPKCYLPQLMTGMCSIDIVDFGIFVDNMIRKCSLRDLKYNPIYDTEFHDTDETRMRKSEYLEILPKAMGIIGIYQKKFIKNDNSKYNLTKTTHKLETDLESAITAYSDFTSDYDSDIERSEKEKTIEIIDNAIINKDFDFDDPNRTDLLDFGEESKMMVDRVFELIDEKKFKVKYMPMSIFEEEIINLPIYQDQGSKFIKKKQKVFDKKKLNLTYKKARKKQKKNVDKFVKFCQKKNYIPIGILPWKLFKTKIIPKKKEPNYLKDLNLEEIIIENMKKLNTVRNLHFKKQQAAIDQLFS